MNFVQMLLSLMWAVHVPNTAMHATVLFERATRGSRVSCRQHPAFTAHLQRVFLSNQVRCSIAVSGFQLPTCR